MAAVTCRVQYLDAGAPEPGFFGPFCHPTFHAIDLFFCNFVSLFSPKRRYSPNVPNDLLEVAATPLHMLIASNLIHKYVCAKHVQPVLNVCIPIVAVADYM